MRLRAGRDTGRKRRNAAAAGPSACRLCGHRFAAYGQGRQGDRKDVARKVQGVRQGILRDPFGRQLLLGYMQRRRQALFRRVRMRRRVTRHRKRTAKPARVEARGAGCEAGERTARR